MKWTVFQGLDFGHLQSMETRKKLKHTKGAQILSRLNATCRDPRNWEPSEGSIGDTNVLKAMGACIRRVAKDYKKPPSAKSRKSRRSR